MTLPPPGQPDACAACAATIAHVATLRLDARCTCGRYYLADTSAANDPRPSRVTGLHPAAAVPAPSAEVAPRHEAREHPPARATRAQHEGPRRVWRAAENDDGPRRVAREREPRRIEDPELVRVRELLAALRPEHTGPFSWGPYQTSADVAVTPEPPRVHVQVSPGGGAGGGLWGWSGGGTPRLPETPRARSAVELVAERIERIALGQPEAARTLRWLQLTGTLKDGLSALYRTTGEALIDEATRARWEARPGARSEGARVVGRRLVLAAESAWVQGG